MADQTTVDTQAANTADAQTNAGQTTATAAANAGNADNQATYDTNEPFKVFSTREDFDKHAAGIRGAERQRAKKELLAILGLSPEQEGELAKFKEAYDASLSEAEKNAKKVNDMQSELTALQQSIAEKDATIAALSKISGKTTEDVVKFVKMAKGLVDDNTTIEQAIEQVMSITGGFEKKQTASVPTGNPLPDTKQSASAGGENPFKTGNYTEQSLLIKNDKEKARQAYMAVYGKYPSW